jgi:hypothetical protein
MGYALLAAMPEYKEKISVLIQMGPVAFVEYFQPPALVGMAERAGSQVRKVFGGKTGSRLHCK